MVLAQLTAEKLALSCQQDLLQRLKNEIAEIEALGFIVFGSASRFEMTEYSDLDLLVVVECDSQLKPISRQVGKISSRLQCPVDFIVITKSHYFEASKRCGVVSEAHTCGLFLKGDFTQW